MPYRTTRQEIEDLEEWAATAHDYLDLLAALARNATSERARTRLAGRIAALEVRIGKLRARRAALQIELAERKPNGLG